MAVEGGRPQKPSDQLTKFLRFIDPNDPTKIMELAVKDTGEVTPDNHKIYALHVDVSEFGAKTVIEVFDDTVAKDATVTTDSQELKSNKGMAITVVCVWDGSATKGAIIWIETSPDDSKWDTVKFVSGLEPPLDAGETAQKTVLVDSAPKFFRIKITNLDLTHGVQVNVYAAIVS